MPFPFVSLKRRRLGKSTGANYWVVGLVWSRAIRESSVGLVYGVSLCWGVFLILSRNLDENQARCGAPLGVPTPSLTAASLLIFISVPTPFTSTPTPLPSSSFLARTPWQAREE